MSHLNVKKLYDVILTLRNDPAVFQDQKKRMRTYKQVISGKDLVKYISEHCKKPQIESIKICQRLLTMGVIRILSGRFRKTLKKATNSIRRKKNHDVVFQANQTFYTWADDKGAHYISFLEELLETETLSTKASECRVEFLRKRNNFLICCVLISAILNLFFLLLLFDAPYIVHLTLLIFGGWLFYFCGMIRKNEPEEIEQELGELDDATQFRETIKCLTNCLINLESFEMDTKDAALAADLLDEKLEEARDRYGFWIHQTMLHCCWNTFTTMKAQFRVLERNRNLLAHTGWSKVDLKPSTLRDVLLLGGIQILPKQAKDGSWLLYFRSCKIDIIKHPIENYFKIMYFLMQRCTELENVVENGITFVVDVNDLCFSQFRKVTSENIEITKLFVDVPSCRWKMLYFVHLPLWVKVVKFMIPSHYTKNCKFVSQEKILEIVGKEALPSQLGGGLKDGFWEEKIDEWISAEDLASERTPSSDGKNSDPGLEPTPIKNDRIQN